MKTITRINYHCDFCNKLYIRKFHAENHELKCLKNPENKRPCFDCKFLTKKETEIYSGTDDYYSGEPIYNKVNFLYCDFKKVFLYTPINEIKNN